MKHVRLIFVLALLAMAISIVGAQDMTYNEAPELAAMVQQGELPPVAERISAEPLVIDGVEGVGNYGGTWRMGLRGGNDGALLLRTVGYEGLVRWNPEWTEVVPNVASSWDINEEGTEFTFYLREGMMWSDGVPFTANDIVFWWESSMINTDVSPTPPEWMVSGGEPGTVEAVDDYTIKFTFAAPNGLFMQRLATPAGTGMMDYPAHAIQQYHPEYNPDGYEAFVEEAGLDNWVDFWDTIRDEWQFVKPTINAWGLDNAMDGVATQVTLSRNPYYWKVDSAGNQYPYFDKVQLDYGEDTETLVLRTLNGEIDMMDRHIATNANKAVFFDNMEAGGYEFFETVPSSMNTMIIALNLTTEETALNEVFNNKDFRIGLSYAINRSELNELIFIGQGEPYQAAPRPTSPFYNEQLAKQYTEYNLDLANEHLDMAGYTERDGDGFRLGPDGNRITFTIDVITVNPDGIDMLELISQYWAEVGIDMRPNVIDRSIFYDRKDANQQQANVWGGDGGLDVILEPRWYFPYSNESNFAPLWRYWYEGDARGVQPPEAPQRQMDLYNEIKVTADPERQNELMEEILQIAADEFYVIGTILTPPGYGIKKVDMKNVPATFPAAWLYPHPGPTNPFTYFYE